MGVGRVAIGHPNWPENIENLKYNLKPPLTVEELEKAKLNQTFISYIANWKIL